MRKDEICITPLGTDKEGMKFKVKGLKFRHSIWAAVISSLVSGFVTMSIFYLVFSFEASLVGFSVPNLRDLLSKFLR